MPKTMGDLVRGERLGPGEYEVVIKSVTDTASKNGSPQVEFRSVTDDGTRHTWWKYLTPKAVVFLVRDLIAAGVVTEDTPAPNSQEEIIETARTLAHELEGQRVRITLSQNGEYLDTSINENTVDDTATSQSEALSRL